MGALHWLILFPYYFFTALTLFLVFSIVSRVTRAGSGANSLALGAIVVSVVLTALPLITGTTYIADYSWPGLVFLLVVSLGLALIDTVLKPSLDLPLDQELEDV